jgi:Protein of unknown function (DUF2975)
MNNVPRSDPLLTVTQLILRVGMALLALGILLAAGAAIALVVIPDQQLMPRLSNGNAIWLVIAGAALVGVMMTLYLFFLQHLSRMVATVGTGDPFQPENADRLQTMAWLTLILQGCMFVLAPLVTMIMDRIGEKGGGLELSFDGLLLALVLFVLARVFRHGTTMRDDLEGTV